MGAFLDKAKTDKHTETGHGNGVRFAVSCEQGWRIEMEDAHSAVVSVPDAALADWSFFGVYDGHAGGKMSSYCSQRLLDELLVCVRRRMRQWRRQQRRQSSPDASSATAAPVADNSDSTPTDCSELNAPAATDGDGRRSEDVGGGGGDDGDEWWRARLAADDEAIVAQLRAAFVDAFLGVDAFVSEHRATLADDGSGSTAVCALLTPTHLLLANCGDSRGVLAGAGGRLALASVDHKPSSGGERARIEAAGGSVLMERVNGSLGVSRALGDFDYKSVGGLAPSQQLVSPEPDVYVHRRRPAADEFLVLACDGVWDVLASEDVCALVHSRLCVTDRLDEIAHHVLDTSFHKGSKDNMSVVLVVFPAAPQVDPEAVARDQAMKQEVRQAVNEYFLSNDTAVAPSGERVGQFDTVNTAPQVCCGESGASVNNNQNNTSSTTNDGAGAAGATAEATEAARLSVRTAEIVNFVRNRNIANLPDGAGIWAMSQFIEDTAVAYMAACNQTNVAAAAAGASSASSSLVQQ